MSSELPHTPEPEAASIDSLPEALGLLETPELARIRAEYIQALSTGSASARELGVQYDALAKAIVSQYQGEAYRRAQVGLILHTGLIYREARRVPQYREELADALYDAQAKGFLDIVPIIEATLRALDQAE